MASQGTEKKTSTGKSVQKYIENVLGESTKAGNSAITAGYPEQSRYTDAYLAGVPYLYQYGDAAQADALGKMGDLYGAYGAAGGYDKTDFSGIGAQYDAAGQYDPTQYENADYTTQNIMDRMTPYEELVSQRATARLKKGYDEGRGEREMQAARQGAYGGSGAAIQEEVARRNYLEQMADMNATNLQSAYEGGVGLYGKELSDRLAAQQAGEASRQFGKNTEMAGLEGVMNAAKADAAQTAAAKEAQFSGLQGQGTSAQQQATLAEQQKNMQLANLSAMRSAGQQQQDEALAKQEYPLDVASKQANLLAPLSGGAIQTKANKPSTAQNILGGVTAGVGIASGLGLGFRAGGYVDSGGGLADLIASYYSRHGR